MLAFVVHTLAPAALARKPDARGALCACAVLHGLLWREVLLITRQAKAVESKGLQAKAVASEGQFPGVERGMERLARGKKRRARDGQLQATGSCRAAASEGSCKQVRLHANQLFTPTGPKNSAMCVYKCDV